MIERFIEQYEAINLALLEVKEDTSDLQACDLKALKELVLILKPFDTATVAMSTQSKCTISSVHPLKYALLASLRQAPITNALVKAARDTMVVNLNSRYADGDSDILLQEASFLDPRYKTMPYLQKTERDKLHEYIVSHCIHFDTHQAEAIDSSNEELETAGAG